MRAARYLAAVDSHTEGMPTRVITGGVGPLPGATMLERKLRFEAERDDLRLLLMREPRGHAAMSGAILQPPTRDDADWGVLFIEVSGCLPMCGHGTIGVATVLVETGMVEVREPETVVRLDTPAGLVEARVAVSGGRAEAVTIRNVPAFMHARDQVAVVDGVGEVPYDMAFGGNFYALVEAGAVGIEVDPARAGDLIEMGARIRTTRASRAVTTSSSMRRGATARTRATRPQSIPDGWTARPAAPAPARAWRRCTRAARSGWGRPSSTSRSSARASPVGSSRRSRSAARRPSCPR